jgi:hypothetical protein
MPYPQRRRTETIEFRERKQQGRVCSVPERLLLFLAVLDMQRWAGAVLEEGAVQEGVQGARRLGRRRWTGLGARDAEGRHPGGGRVAETQEDAGGGAHEAEAMGRGASAQGLTGEGERSRGGAGRCRRSKATRKN